MRESGSAEVEKSPAKQSHWVQEHQPCSLQLRLCNDGKIAPSSRTGCFSLCWRETPIV